MPWTEVEDEHALKLHKQTGVHYVLFFASDDPATGEPWCPDCREATEPLENVFNAQDAPTVNVVRVGQKPEWKSPDNKWHAKPYEVKSIPTLVKLDSGKEIGRLEEDDCQTQKNIEKLVEKKLQDGSWGCTVA